MESIKDILLKFIEDNGLTVNKFEVRCGLSTGYIKNLKNSPSASKMVDILEAFPTLRERLPDDFKVLHAEHLEGNVNSNNVNSIINENNAKFLDIIAKQQEQMGQLIATITRLTEK